MNTEALRAADARAKFKEWLERNGCAVLEPTSEWELVRYRGANGTGVLYTNKKNQLTPNGPMRAILTFYLTGKEYTPGTKRKRRDKRQQVVDRLLIRDGHSLCFYCMREMSENDRTLEHLVDLKYQGPDNIHNMVLAHTKCNNELSHLTPIEKIRIHDRAILTVGKDSS
jgi:hypothetical protein